MVLAYKRIDKQKNLICAITPEWIVDNLFSGQVCVYCGESNWKKLGCDRMDNTFGHTPDNVVCSCLSCNSKHNDNNYWQYKLTHNPETIKIIKTW